MVRRERRGRPPVKAVVKAIVAVLALAAASAAGAAPARIVSVNTCADQYLIAMADPSQVLALTQFAGDRQLSFYAEKGAAYPTIRGRADEILELGPDLVIFNLFGNRETRALVERLGLPTLTLPYVDSLAGVLEETRKVGEAIGQEVRAEALAAEIAAAFAAPPPTGARRLTALYYQRAGYVTGRATLMDEIMTAAGLYNLGAQLGVEGVGRVTLETVVAARPDILILDRDPGRPTDRGAELLVHPALESVVPPERRIVLPQRLYVCGGPSLIAAVAELKRLVAALAE